MKPNKTPFAATAAVVLALVLTGLQAPLAASATTIGPGTASIAYVGRWDKSSSTEYVSHWGGAYLKTDFSGTSISLELGAAADIMVSIDGGSDQQYTQATGTTNIAPSGLSAGIHTLRVAARYMDDAIHFRGITLGTGGVLSAPAVSSKLIEFIGDSITAGISNTNKALSDYSWLAAEQLHAEHTQIAYSGICLIDRKCYDPNTTGMSTQYFKREPITYPTQTAWDFSSYQPTAVVINLGTNDQLYGPAENPAVFQSAYVTFLQNIRTRYPNAEIFALRTFNGYFETQTQNAVTAVSDSHIHYIDTTGWISSSDTTDGVHPTDRGQVKLASDVAVTLAPYLYPQNVSGTPTPPTIEDFQNTSDWQYGPDYNAFMFTTGTAATLSVIGNGSNWGSMTREFTYNVDTSPYLSIRVNSVSNQIGTIPQAKWALKLNAGATDIPIQGDTSQTGLFTYNLRAITGWTGTKTFRIKLFAVDDSVEFSSLTLFNPQVALGKTVTASSTVNGNLASYLTDGNLSTRWESQGSDPQWVTVDLGGNQTIDTVLLRWETAAASTYDVQTSLDNQNWTTASHKTNGQQGATETIPITPTIARYVRILMSARASQWAYSMYEFEVYRKDLAVGAPLQVSSTTNGNLGTYLTDGDPNTRWESSPAGSSPDVQAFLIDLGSSQTVGRVVLNWEAASAKSFEVRLSNDRYSWTTVASTTNGPGLPTMTFTPQNARYVWVYMTDRLHHEWAYSLWDAAVYPQ